MATKPETPPTYPPRCKRCGKPMLPLYDILDPATGKQIKAFKCECGNRAVG